MHIKRLMTATVAFVIILSLNCSPKISDSIDNELSRETHVAFAGGGWRAHTGHSAWIMSLLQANNNPGGCSLTSPTGNATCLQSAFKNIKTISSNSGGSWFSTMLMYDAGFVNQITNQNAISNWGSTVSGTYQGWLGRQKNAFAGFTDCSKKKGNAYLECVIKDYFSGSSLDPYPNWNLVVQNLVYKGYQWQSYGKLNDRNHLNWAKDKTLLMAGTWLTNSVLLNDQDNETYYQVCAPGNTVVLNGENGGSCITQGGATELLPDILPVTFTSLAETGPTRQKPSFIGTTSSTYPMGYSGTPKKDPQTATNSLVTGANQTDYVPVISAATASSAATGYSTSYNVMKSKCDTWDCVYHAQELSVAFSIPNGTTQVNHIDNITINQMSLKTLRDNRLLRVADGGVIDNSGIIQLIGYLQLNSKGNGFNIVAFDEVQSNDSRPVDRSKYPSSDISYLFNDSPTGKYCEDGWCVQLPKLKILELPPAVNPIAHYTWTVVTPDGQPTSDKLDYYIYTVKTVSNSTFNIAGGSTGTLHVFSSQFGTATTAPDNQGAFASYESMIKNFGPTLQKMPDNGTSPLSGLEILKQAFGL
ncbi:MAG: hypothetical protein HEP71_24735 [Roseivirga sp.]|nr:hypothetical protein [Roseivirga sp.]